MQNLALEEKLVNVLGHVCEVDCDGRFSQVVYLLDTDFSEATLLLG